MNMSERLSYPAFDRMMLEKGYTLGDLPLSGEDAEGNDVILSAASSDGGIVWTVHTYQENGWVRINNYYPDGTIDELFDR